MARTRLLVRHQDDFAHRGVLTLQKLEEEVHASDVVLHILRGRDAAGETVEDDGKGKPSALTGLDVSGERSHAVDETGLAEDVPLQILHALAEDHSIRLVDVE